ncbi:MAG: autotransporter outer membrane beta-barrel domain-containing protein [Planctomycetaceae bacterium]|nr:autotransporter outer membrane beta-barrel domain-containing protein [Planctomycetaceae bacterium]
MTVSKIVQQRLLPLFAAGLLFAGFLFTGLPNLSAQTGSPFDGNTVLHATGAYLVAAQGFHHTLLDRMQPSHTIQQYGAISRFPSCDTARGQETLWGKFTQNRATQADVGLYSGYEYRPSAFAFGKERRNGHWITGLAGEYSHGRVKGGNNVWTDTQLDTAALGLYAGYFGKQNYLKGNMQFGVGWNKEATYDRSSVTRSYGSYRSAALGTGLELGRTWNLMCAVNPVTVTPHMGTDYWFLNREAFHETGVDAKSFGSVNYNVVEIPVGLRIARTIPMTGGKANGITPSVDMVYARSVGDGTPVGRVGSISMPGTWDARGTEPGRDIFRMNTAVTGRFCHRVDAGLGFDFEVRNHYTAKQLHFTVAVTR